MVKNHTPDPELETHGLELEAKAGGCDVLLKAIQRGATVHRFSTLEGLIQGAWSPLAVASRPVHGDTLKVKSPTVKMITVCALFTRFPQFETSERPFRSKHARVDGMVDPSTGCRDSSARSFKPVSTCARSGPCSQSIKARIMAEQPEVLHGARLTGGIILSRTGSIRHRFRHVENAFSCQVWYRE